MIVAVLASGTDLKAHVDVPFPEAKNMVFVDLNTMNTTSMPLSFAPGAEGPAIVGAMASRGADVLVARDLPPHVKGFLSMWGVPYVEVKSATTVEDAINEAKDKFPKEAPAPAPAPWFGAPYGPYPMWGPAPSQAKDVEKSAPPGWGWMGPYPAPPGPWQAPPVPKEAIIAELEARVNAVEAELKAIRAILEQLKRG